MSSFSGNEFDDATAITAPVVQDRKKLGKKKSAQQQHAAAAAASTAAAAIDSKPATMVTAPASKNIVTPTPAASTSAPPEPEQHVDGDAIESAMRKLKGTRPELLRTSTYYEGAKVGIGLEAWKAGWGQRVGDKE